MLGDDNSENTFRLGFMQSAKIFMHVCALVGIILLYAGSIMFVWSTNIEPI
jgi:hypothetical protein